MLTITNEDNMELMARYPDKYFDLAIVDPPYGIGFDGKTTVKGKSGKANTFSNKQHHIKKGWDNERPSQEYFNELKRVSKNQIIWGGNYFADLLEAKKGWIFWDKKITNANNTNYSDGELAWTSIKTVTRMVNIHRTHLWQEKPDHPTQKPIKLYKWILDKYAKQGDKILDTHLGSGSIAIAAHDYKYELTACELDKEYYDKAIQRIKNHTNQQKLF